MPRPTKPYLRKQTKSWYCSIAGRQISLGKDRKLAFEKFHELMADKPEVRSNLSTLYELSQVYLDWCEANRKPGTYNPPQVLSEVVYRQRRAATATLAVKGTSRDPVA